MAFNTKGTIIFALAFVGFSSAAVAEIIVRGLGIVEFDASTFRSHVIQAAPGNSDPASWIVYFCAKESEKCQLLLPSYENLGRKLEDKVNTNQLESLSVRFAKLDCTAESTLCSELGIHEYPIVMHYYQHEKVANWTSVSKSNIGLYPWLQGELGLSSSRLRGQGSCTATATSTSADHTHGEPHLGTAKVTFFGILLVCSVCTMLNRMVQTALKARNATIARHDRKNELQAPSHVQTGDKLSVPSRSLVL